MLGSISVKEARQPTTGPSQLCRRCAAAAAAAASGSGIIPGKVIPCRPLPCALQAAALARQATLKKGAVVVLDEHGAPRLLTPKQLKRRGSARDVLVDAVSRQDEEEDTTTAVSLCSRRYQQAAGQQVHGKRCLDWEPAACRCHQHSLPAACCCLQLLNQVRARFDAAGVPIQDVVVRFKGLTVSTVAKVHSSTGGAGPLSGRLAAAAQVCFWLGGRVENYESMHVRFENRIACSVIACSHSLPRTPPSQHKSNNTCEQHLWIHLTT